MEPSHAFAEAIKISPNLTRDTIVIVNSCGDAKKDRDILKMRLKTIRVVQLELHLKRQIMKIGQPYSLIPLQETAIKKYH